MPEPIDYARADSADVVRKKFRRRVVMFVIATVVVMVVGSGWATSINRERLILGSNKRNLPVSVLSKNGWCGLFGSKQSTSNSNWKRRIYFRNELIGLEFAVPTSKGPKWGIAIRYRTLFILAMIPWIIILIRMIRVWKRKRAAAQLTSDF